MDTFSLEEDDFSAMFLTQSTSEVRNVNSVGNIGARGGVENGQLPLYEDISDGEEVTIAAGLPKFE